MPGPKPPTVELTGEERAELERLVRRHATGQRLAGRARIALLAADGPNNGAVARALAIDVDTVRKWRGRWRRAAGVPVAERGVAARLADAPRSGTPARITPEPVCRIVAPACEAPSASGRPISQWGSRALLRRGSFTSVDDLTAKVPAFIAHPNRTAAGPFKWTYQGKPLTTRSAESFRPRCTR
jgi:putative transposase